MVLDISTEKTEDGRQIPLFISKGEIASLWQAETFLRDAIQTFHKPFLGLIKKPFTALVSVPSVITEPGKRAIRDIAGLSGAKNVYMLHDALIAAVGLGLAVEDISTVVDFGAGKTIITTLHGYEIERGELLDICGKGLDVTIQHYVMQAYDLLIDIDTARKLKEDHLDLSKTMTDWSISVSGKGRNTNNDRIVCISHSELVACISDDINDLIDKVITHIGWLEDEYSDCIRQKGIYLMGNSFKMKGLINMVAEKIVVASEAYTGIDYLGVGLKKIQTQQLSDDILRYVLE